jgi:hypothetical protein
MSELILLNLDRAEFLGLHKAAERGDQAAREALAHLWDDYDHVEIECFLCSELVEKPPFTHVLPEFSDGKDGNDTKLIGTPLCAKCRDLPHQIRWSRSLKILVKMFSAKLSAQRGRKKRVSFHFSGQQRHHPR